MLILALILVNPGEIVQHIGYIGMIRTARFLENLQRAQGQGLGPVQFAFSATGDGLFVEPASLVGGVRLRFGRFSANWTSPFQSAEGNCDKLTSSNQEVRSLQRTSG